VSTFLGFESLLIALGSTNQNVLDQFRTSLTGYGWQCVRKSVYPVATLGTLGTVANAFNKDCTTSASSTAALPLWIGAQTANPFTPTVMFLQISTNGTYFPSNFTLDWSDDGSTWTTHQTWTGEPNAIKFWEKRRYVVTNAPAKNYWRLNVTARLTGTTTELDEWILEDASGTQITNYGFIDVIPPSYETIGNSWTREVVRISVSGSTIAVNPIQELLQPIPMLWAFNGVAGAVTCSITINGVTVSFVGTAGNTAIQNARGLFEACKTSADANFLSYTWQWINYEYHFVAYKNTPVLQASNAVTGTNITIYPKGGYCGAPMSQAIGWSTNAASVTMDVSNGFIYYLQVHSRSLALATKTNVGYYGPIHICYGDNASAIAQLPTPFIPAMPITPIELLVGTNDVAANTGGSAKFSHWWVSTNIVSNTPRNMNDYYDSANLWNGNTLYINICDMSSNGYAPSNYITSANGFATVRAEGIYTGADTGTGYRLHRMVLDPDTVWAACCSTSYSGRGFGPVYNKLDWYRITGTLTDEQLIMMPGTDFSTQLTANCTATDTTINVVSTAGFLSAGYIVIEGESIQYTGITSTSFTGCTRGKYATAALAHFINDTVYIGTWMVKINTGLLFAGYTKPV
jgi:hypothetical protein